MCRAFEEIREEGRMEGRLEGRMEMKLDFAKNLLRHGKLTLDEIAEMTGLPIARIAQLKESMA